jgi:hypothetical protein
MSSARDTVNESSAGLIGAPREALGGIAPVSEAALGEVLAFPAEHLGGLPVATRFVMQGLGISQPIVWTSEAKPDCRDGIVFDAEELRALVSGVQAERLWPADLKGFCLRKLHDSSFRVNEPLVLGGAQPVRERPWSLGRVLRWFDLELERIDLAGDHGPSTGSRVAAA